MLEQTEEEETVAETIEATGGDNLDEFTSPPVSRAEVQELFQTWRNPSSVGQRSDDSGVGSNESGSKKSKGQSIRFDNTNNGAKKKRAVNKKMPLSSSTEELQTAASRSSRGSVINNNKAMTSSTGSLDHKLPRLVPPNNKGQTGGMLLGSPPHHPNNQPPTLNERRRFINVVRPLSYFPEPALPPNYILPVKPDTNAFSNSPNNNAKLSGGRPPSPAPFYNGNNRRRQQQNQPANFSLAGQGVTTNTGSSNMKLNLAGGSGWDLTAIRRGYNNTSPLNNGKFGNKAMQDNRNQYQGARYQSQNGLDPENLPLTDDWRRHIDARRKALARRKARRRGVADGGSNMIGNGDRSYNGSVQTEGNFEELLRRSGDVESGMQTDSPIEGLKRKSASGGNLSSLENTSDGSTQVKLDELPEFEMTLLPQVEELINHTLEQAFVEALEEEEIKEIRSRRLKHQQVKQAELTTSRLMNVPE